MNQNDFGYFTAIYGTPKYWLKTEGECWSTWPPPANAKPHAVLMTSGKVWDEVNGWRDESYTESRMNRVEELLHSNPAIHNDIKFLLNQAIAILDKVATLMKGDR